MSSLSFREQAAIALFAMPETAEVRTPTVEVAVGCAQKLADRCCLEWGHQPPLFDPFGFHDRTDCCRRCGADMSKAGR